MSDPTDIPEKDLGVALDTAAEYHIQLVAATEWLSMVHADLDGYADGEFSAAPTAHLREAQEHLREAHELMGSEANVVETRIEAIRARLTEVSGGE